MSVETAHAMAVRERDPGGDERGSGRDERRSGRDERGSGAGGDGSQTGPEWIGVVRSPPGWFRRRVDALCPELGLSAETRAALDERRRDLRMQGLCEAGAHNAAWAELAVDDRYRARLRSDPATEQVAALASRAEPLVLATARQPGLRCHREVLATALDARRGQS
jgi:hypothetical protein